MKFVALDFETATPTRESACALGAVFVEFDEASQDLRITGTFSEMIRPPGNRYARNLTAIHGISPKDTEDAATFDVVWRRLEDSMDGHVVAAHNAAFDISVIRASAAACQFNPKSFDFLCTYRLAQAHWPALKAWKLDYLADWADLPLENHHHALSDANACAHLLMRFHEESAAGATEERNLLNLLERYNFQVGRVDGSTYTSFSKMKKTSRRSKGNQLPGLSVDGNTPAAPPVNPQAQDTKKNNVEHVAVLPPPRIQTRVEAPLPGLPVRSSEDDLLLEAARENTLQSQGGNPPVERHVCGKHDPIEPHLVRLSKPAISTDVPPTSDVLKEYALISLTGKKVAVVSDGLWVLVEGRKPGQTATYNVTRVSVKGRKLLLPGGAVSLRGVRRRDRKRLSYLLREGGRVGAALHVLLAWSRDFQGTVVKATKDVQWVPLSTVRSISDGKPGPSVVDTLKARKLVPLVTEQLSEAFEDLDKDVPRVFESINKWVLETEKVQRRYFFDSIEKDPLTEEQIEAVVAMDNSVQVVASAGSGKTSLMVARAAYAVHRGFCDPENILMLAFNRDAADELAERVAERFSAAGIPHEGVKATTFHSFGLSVIAEATGSKPKIAPWLDLGSDLHEVERIVKHLEASDKKFKENWVKFKMFYADSPTSESESRPDRYDREEERGLFQTADGKFVRSYGEKKIADWLYMHGITYEYEKPFSMEDTSSTKHSQYCPDFFYPDIETWHEHWGLDKDGNPPPRWDNYLDGIEWKRGMHLKHNTDLIETTFYNVVFGNGLEVLLEDLERRGLRGAFDPTKPNLTPYPVDDAKVAKLIRTFMSHFKSGRYSKKAIAELASSDRWEYSTRTHVFLEVYWAIHDEWHRRLSEGNFVDFEDMLLSAADHLYAGNFVPAANMVLVDEMQDSSKARAELVKGLISQGDKFLLAVGDDWQSINRFAGADIGVMTNFESYFGPGPVFKLTKTFRCSPEICEVSSEFISVNEKQIAKKVVPADENPRGPVTVVCGPSADDAFLAAVKTIRADATAKGIGSPTALVLGRYGFDREAIPTLKEMAASPNPAVDLRFMTVHKAKGLEADYVVVVNNKGGRYGFPSQIEDDDVLNLVIPAEDGFAHSEERRLMYVAMTRAKQQTILLVDTHSISTFAEELCSIPGTVSVSVLGEEIARPERCPRCRKGVLSLKETEKGSFMGCNEFPACGFIRKIKPKGAISCRTCESGFYVERQGKYGAFLGCSEYPRCTSTRDLEPGSYRRPDISSPGRQDTSLF